MPRTKRSLNAVYISERVQECLRPISRCPLTAVVAPMGYGKTTAVNWFLNRRAKEDRAEVIRVSIYDDDLPLFWKRVQNAFACQGLPFLSEYPCPADRESAALLEDELCRTLAGERPCYIFLDDFHLLSDGRVTDFLCSLANRMPENVHLIAASRDSFLSGGAVVRLGSRLHQIGAGQLRLNHTELSAYARLCGARLNDRQVEDLLRSSEGWFSAIYLNLRSLTETGALMDGSADIYQMFTSALLDPLGPPEQEFLAVMSLADEFSAPMARAVTGLAEVEPLLSSLTEQNAFVTRLPDGGYRFHHMMKACAGTIFARLDREKQRACLSRYGRWYEAHGQYLQAMAAYEQGEDPSGWLRAVAEDAGVMLASRNPAAVLAQLQKCPPETVKADPRAILVLMRRFFSWGKFKEMLELKALLLAAVEDPALSAEDRGNLLGECDLIMSFLCYNDIEGMSRLHQSACRQMTRPAVSIRTYGSFTFGSPSVLMMFHRTPGQLDAEVRTMNRAMPYYYRVTAEHGAGAEQVMEAEAAFLRGDFPAARLLNAKARYRAQERDQTYIALCCDLLALRLHLADPESPFSLDPAEEREQLKRRRDATLLLTFESALAYYCALLGAPEKVPPLFANHQLGDVNILNPARPMLLLIENQVRLAQGRYPDVIGCSDSLLALCSGLHYALVGLHVRLQTAAAYEALGRPAEAAALFREALDAARPDGILLPFSENYRDLAPLFREDDPFQARAAQLGRDLEARCARLRQRIARPAEAAALTDREMEIATLAAARTSNKEIAARLYLSEGTVKQYVNRIYAKLQIEGDTRTKRERLAALLDTH